MIKQPVQQTTTVVDFLKQMDAKMDHLCRRSDQVDEGLGRVENKISELSREVSDIKKTLGTMDAPTQSPAS